MSLRDQLLGVLLLLTLAILGAIGWVSVQGTRTYLEQQLASHAQDTATALSVPLGQSLGKADTVLAEAQVASMFDRGYFKRIEVLGADRRSLVKRELPDRIEGVPLWFVTAFHIGTPAGEAFVGSGWRQLGKVVVISQPTYAYQHLWRTTVELLWWLAGITAAAAALVMAVLHFILKPLRDIERTAVAVQAKRFEQITSEPVAPELARVVHAMNDMSRRVGEMLDAETAKARALYQQAYEDELTGLVNRRGYELRLAELLHGEHHFGTGAVVTLELDDMRLLSREFGFASGEQLMRVMVQCARDTLGQAGASLLARTNDYSFSFVLIDVPRAGVSQLAADFHRSVLAQLADFVPAQRVAINVGVAFFLQDDQRSDVFARADLAVESARQSGRNGFHVLDDAQDENTSLGSFGWRTLIQSALVESRWRLLRQPVLTLGEQQLVLQAECMARLVDQQGELVPASHFMPMAARHRLMPDVDRAMVTLALQHVKASATPAEVVAINLSPQSVADGAFMDWLVLQMEALAGKGSRLAFELSEFGVLRNVQAAHRLREVVRLYGGKFGIDHFGVNPRAIELMRELLPDYVKLTGALMQEIEAVEAVSDMLQSFVKLAHSLDVMVIAQQVERAGQVAVLTRSQVDAGQGYFFGAPE
nr:EAL domain-containing protein [uncultured Rhodoferax sp.]